MAKAALRETPGRRLREERLRLGLRQPTLALMSNVNNATLRKYESGELSLPGHFAERLALYDFDVSYIMTGNRGLSPSELVWGSKGPPIPIDASYPYPMRDIGIDHVMELPELVGHSAFEGEDARQTIFIDAAEVRRIKQHRFDDLYYIHICDDSFAPQIPPNSTLLIDTEDRNLSADDQIWLVIHDGDLKIKRITRQAGAPDAELELYCDHPQQQVELGSLDTVKILGRVICKISDRPADRPHSAEYLP